MKEQENFFSQNHRRVLSIATWANYIAWFMLFVSFILPFMRYIQIQTSYTYQQAALGQVADFIQAMKINPVYAISVFVDMLNSWLNGFIYFLVAKGISLGLNMIVETDINYRENASQEEKQ